MLLLYEQYLDNAFAPGFRFDSPFYPEMIKACFPENRRFIEDVSDSSVTLVTKKYGLSIQDDPETTPLQVIQQITSNELAALDRAAYGIDGKDHQISLDSVYFYYGVPHGFDPLDLSIAVTKAILRRDLGSREWIRLAFGRVYKTPPSPPRTPFALADKTTQRIYKVPSDLVVWHLKSSIRYMFLYIYRTINLLSDRNLTFPGIYSSDHPLIAPTLSWVNEYNSFDIMRTNKKGFLLVYQPVPSWQSIIVGTPDDPYAIPVSISPIHQYVFEKMRARCKGGGIEDIVKVGCAFTT